MNKIIIFLLAGVFFTPIINAQTMEEKRAAYEMQEKERSSFNVYLSKNGETYGINPQTKQRDLVKNYIGVFVNQSVRKKLVVQYMPSTQLVASYFIEEDDNGNVFYVESFLNEHGINFTKTIMSTRILEILHKNGE